MANIGIHSRVACRAVQRPNGSGASAPEPYAELHFDTIAGEPSYVGRDSICFYPRSPEDMRQWAAAILAAAEELEDAIEVPAIADAKKRERDEREAQAQP